MNNIALTLASESPRRKSILDDFSFTFEIVPHEFNEKSLKKNTFKSPRHYVKECCRQKAWSLKHKKLSYPWILSVDTIVVYGNRILEKPESLEKAIENLLTLQGNTHQVLSALSLYNSEEDKTLTRSESVSVSFNPISKSDIHKYVHKHKPLDKAGGYGLQELPKSFIKSVKGSAHTVIGLPIYLLKKTIRSITKTI